MEDRGGVMETPDRLLTSTDQLLQTKDNITINIRSPVSTIEDLRVVCPQDWRVLRLKEEIAKLFPGNPSPDSQKLVYAGKMLEDGDRLKQFIRFQDECAVYTIHLVCQVSQIGSEAPQLRQRRPEATPAAAPQLPTNTLYQDVNSWAQYMQLSEQTQFTEDNLQQMAVMQEMYSQYLSQYMQYMQTGGVVPTSPPAEVAAEAREGGRAPAAAVMNAGGPGGGAQPFQDEDEPGNRDMLDWLYVSIRVLILLSIVYFYSSLSRFVLVAAIFLVLYSFQVGLWPVNNRDRDNIQQEVNNIRDQQQQQQQLQQQQQQQDAAEEAGAEESAAPEERVEPPAPNIVDVLFTFITTFFTSIIPEQIQLI